MLLGKAPRHKEKRVRVATHEPVIKFICEQLKISYVIEDGMGISSTPLFHKLKIKNLISFETRQEWTHCENCENNDDTKHQIFLGNFDTNKFKKEEINFDKTLVFIDGYSSETRLEVFEIIVKFQPIVIIEHDAEALDIEEINTRRKLAENYTAFQYIGQNPETLLFVKNIEKIIVDENYVSLG